MAAYHAFSQEAYPQIAESAGYPTDREDRLHVLMITEGTYPFHWGGVSTWCHLLLTDLSHIDFTLMSLVGDPGAALQFELPRNVVDFRPIPLWGIREVLETRPDLGWRELIRRRRSANETTVEKEFIPHFRAFLQALFSYDHDSHAVAREIHQMYRFFITHDFDTAMRSEATWRCFVDVAQAAFPRLAAAHGYRDARYNLADLTTCMQWLYHWFFPIGAPLPRTDLVHAAMAGVSTLIAVAAKFEYGTPYLLTEHGIYLRERYLAEAATAKSLFRKIFSLRFAHLMTKLSYGLADRIAPCCEYNHRWELKHGARLEQIRTIYYGVDSVAFTPQEKTFGEPPVVVWMGRIDPLKDILTLLRAAALVYQARPDIEFRLFGGVMPGTEAYYARCLELHRELGLENVVKFAGFRANPVSAFNEGDIVILTSVSEAFPFVVLEAMLCEKPVVATAVGGVPEQVAGCGVALEPRNPTALARAILHLMNNPELCRTLGKAAREKAIQQYSLRQSGSAHEDVYRYLTRAREAISVLPAVNGKTAPGEENGNGHKGLRVLAAPTAIVHNGHITQDSVEAVAAVPASAVQPVVQAIAQHSDAQPNGFSSENGASQLHPADTGASKNGETFAAYYNSAYRNAMYGNRDRNKRLDSHPEPGGMGNGNGKSFDKNNRNGREHGNGSRNSSGPDDSLGDDSLGNYAPISEGMMIQDEAESDYRSQAGEILALTGEVAQQVVNPLDTYEIAALLESIGITDQVARQRYGAKDVFALGHAVLRQMRKQRLARRDAETLPLVPAAWRSRLHDYSKGLVGLAAPVMLLLILFAFGRWGGMAAEQILVLGAGMTTSLLATSGFIQAISYRTATYLSLRKPRMAARYLALVTSIMTALIIVAALVGFQLFIRWYPAYFQESIIFLAAFIGLAILWMAAGGLALVERAYWLSLALAGGLAVGLLISVATRPYVAVPPAVGLILGYGAALSIVGYALYRGYAAFDRGAAAASVYRFPAPAYLLAEAWPYFVYGALYMLVILLPHVLGWMGYLPGGQAQMLTDSMFTNSGPHATTNIKSWNITNIEVGMTLSMPPLILAYGVAEHALHRFWHTANAIQASTAGDQVARFGEALNAFCVRQRKLYMVVVGSLTFLAYWLFHAAVEGGLLTAWLHISELSTLSLIFNLSLAAYALLGIGLFNCMFAVTLQRPRVAVISVGLALATLLAMGIELAAINFALVPIAFVCAAAIFAAVSWILTTQTVKTSDYSFASVI